MQAISHVLITYFANSFWMACLCALAATEIDRILRNCASAHQHTLWVSALIVSSLLPIASLSNTLGDWGADVNEVSVATASSGFSQRLNEPLRPLRFWQRVHRSLLPIQFAPLVTSLLSVLYLGFIAHRCLSLFWAWRRTRRIQERAIPCLKLRGDTVLRSYDSALSTSRVSLVCSHDLDAPAVLGTLRPLLVLPHWFIETCSEEEIASALSHELAHVHRYDFLLNFLCELFLLPLCFHPAAWFIKKRIEHTREMACDEIAAKQLSSSATYARSLVSIAQRIAKYSGGMRSSYALSLFDTNSLEARIMNLLKRKDNISRKQGRIRLALASFVFVITCALASVVSIQVAMAAAPQDVAHFSGTWEGKFKGKTFVTVILTSKDGKVSGRVSRLSLEIDANGNVTEASALDGQDEIAETTPQGNVLHLITKAKGKVDTASGESDESIQYDMTLTGGNEAELQIAETPVGMSPPKPWKLERTASPK